MDWIFLYGPPGSGKSTLGKRLAESLAVPFYDLDDLIEIQAGISIAEIFARYGEAEFRQRERANLLEMLEKAPGVAALGGGALLDERNRSLVENVGAVICLTAPFETLLARSQAQAGQPVKAPQQGWAALQQYERPE